MVDAQLDCEYAEDDMIFGGDGEELLSNTLSIIASFYAGLLRQCDDCAQFYREVLEDPDTLKEVFNEVYKSYLEHRDEESDDEECFCSCNEELDEYPTPIPFRKRSKDGFKGGNGLCGLDNLK